MEGYINENRWIDLSGLSRISRGNKSVIDWKHSVGCELPFKYDDVSGNIKIEQYITQEKHDSSLYITIDKYVPQFHKIRGTQLATCQIHNLVSNRIVNVAPELIPYLKNPDDAYLYPYQSNNRIWIKCPICGNEDLVEVSHLYLQGKQCTVCGDGVSYPEKFMRSVFDQLGIKYIKQANKSIAGFEWAMSYRYDFAFCVNKNWFIVEADGGFHRYQADIDRKKDILATSNGFEMIRIDCDYGHYDKMEFIKTQILNSRLADIFDLTAIQWDKCNKYATSTIIKTVCGLWENTNLSIKEIAEIVHLARPTIWRYLKDGLRLGLCPSYNVDAARKRRRPRRQNKMIEKNINNNEVVFNKEAII